MPKMTTSGADLAINQADSASPLTRTDIPAIVDVIRRSLLPQHNQETTSSLPSNQLTSQQHLLQLTQLDTKQQQPNQYLQQQLCSSSTPS